MSDLIYIKRFLQARMNLDDLADDLQPNEFREIKNVRLNTGVEGNINSAELPKGNTEVENTYLPTSGSLFALKVLRHPDIRALIFFIYHSAIGGSESHGIYQYNLDEDEFQVVLKHSILNFQPTYQITGADIIDGILYWTDGYEDPDDPFAVTNRNPPRKLNINKAIAYSASPWGENQENVRVWEEDIEFNHDYCLYLNYIYKCKYDSIVGKHPSGTKSDNYYWFYYGEYKQDEIYLEINEQVIDRIIYPPTKPPELCSDTDVITYKEGDLNFKLGGYGTDYNYDGNLVHGNLYQFCYRYIYSDNEKSRWSDKSKVPYPTGNELPNGLLVDNQYTNNVIGIKIDTGSVEVKTIEIACRKGNTGAWKIVERIYKYDEYNMPVRDTVYGVPGMPTYRSNAEAYYLFYNNVEGEVIVQEDVFIDADYVPQISKYQTLIEKNRIIDGDITENYDNVKIDVQITPDYIKHDFQDSQTNFSKGYYTAPAYPWHNYRWITIDAVEPGQIYFAIIFFGPVLKPYGTQTDPPTVCSYVAQDGDTIKDVIDYLMLEIRKKTVLEPEWWSSYPNNLNVPDKRLPFGHVNDFIGYRLDVLKSISSWKLGNWARLGIVYGDRANRVGGTNISKNSEIYIPSAAKLIKTNAIDSEPIYQVMLKTEIHHIPPKWAKWYKWVLVDKPTFIQIAVAGNKFEKDTARGLIKIQVNYPIEQINEDFPASVLKNWEFEKGDRIRFISIEDSSGDIAYFQEEMDWEILDKEYPMNDTAFLKDEVGMAIFDAEGNKVHSWVYVYFLIQNNDLENSFTLTGDNKVVIEIYRPNKIVDDENVIYHSLGEVIPILNPHTENRMHGAGSGTYSQDQTSSQPAIGTLEYGNCFVKGRVFSDTFLGVEAMNYSDYYSSETLCIGNPYIYNRELKRKRLFAYFRWGNKKLINTQINNICKFDPSDIDNVKEQHGPIYVLKEIGYTLKVLQRQKNTSFYVGRSGLEMARANKQYDIVAAFKDDTVLGPPMTSEDEYGCINPESYVKVNRYAYFWDVLNKCIVRDAANGMVNISDEFKVNSWVREKSEQCLSSLVTRYRIQGGYNPITKEVFWTVVLNTERSDYPAVETIIFHENSKAWTHFVDWRDGNNGPDCYGWGDDRLFSFLDGVMYEHETNELRNNYYGVQYYPEINFVVNNENELIKIFKSISLFSNAVWYCPEYTDIYIPPNVNYFRGMKSRLKSSKFVGKEGKYVAHFLKNAVTRQDTPNGQDLITGEDLRGKIMHIRITNEETSACVLTSIAVHMNVSNPIKR